MLNNSCVDGQDGDSSTTNPSLNHTAQLAKSILAERCNVAFAFNFKI